MSQQIRQAKSWAISSLYVWNCFKYFLIRQERFWDISSLYVQNCFEYFLIYILGQNVSKKSDNKNFEICKVFMCYILLNTYILGQNVSKKVRQ